MVTLLITTVAVLAVLGIGLYLWQRPAPDSSVNVLPPQPNARGLFAEEFSTDTDDEEQLALIARRQEELIKEANTGERSALDEAHLSGDAALYDRVLSALVAYSDSDPKLLSLVSYVGQHELPVNHSLAEAVIASWRQAPDRSGTAKALHFAALSDNPDLFRRAVESALHLWREAKLTDISVIELRALFDGEFWVLSSRSRSSGAGFVLKRTLESARRELEAAAGAKQ
jgi:hypothetical protein